MHQITSGVYEADFLDWMGTLGLRELWEFEPKYRTSATKSLKLIYDIHLDPSLRLAINALLIKAQSFEQIATSLNSKYSALLKELHIELYKKYFWNPQIMTRRSWKEYLKNCESNETSIYFMALTEPLNILQNALELPSKASSSAILQHLLIRSYRKAKEYMDINTPAGSKEAREWNKQVMALIDKYEKYRVSDSSDFGKELQLEFEYVDTDFPTPDEELLKEMRLQESKIDTKSGDKNIESSGIEEENLDANG